MSNGIWLLPSKNRLNNLKRFLGGAREMGTNTPGWILINRDDWEANYEAYLDLERYFIIGWRYKIVDATCYGEAIRAVWDEVKDLDWIGLVSDDLVPCTSTWDKMLLSHVNGWNVVSSNDGWQAPHRIHGAIIWSGLLARAVGWIFPPGFRHIYHDDVWEMLGKETGVWACHMDILCKHLHESLEGVIGPTMDRESDLWKHDEAAFAAWLENDMPRCVEEIKKLQASYNIRSIRPKFDGVRLMIASPTMDGTYNSHFVQSIFSTMRLLQQHGVTVEWAEEKHTADVALARSKMFSVFMRSQCTHLLMVDADMGWGTEAIIRLFAADSDFVTVAGPKKRYPLCFAVNHSAADGTPLPLEFDQQRGTMEVSEVGLAFAMISKACAQKIAESYPELTYTGLTGEKEYAVFNPMVEHDRYFSEDFAFCRRWYAVGGVVHMIPDVRLKHVGAHVFEGSFSDAIKDQIDENARKAANL
jgi:hypothetical protein